MRKKLTSFSGTIKNLKKNNKLKIEESALGNLSRTFLSSLIIISIFFIAPLAINLTKEKIIFSKNHENIPNKKFLFKPSFIFGSCFSNNFFGLFFEVFS